MLRKGLANTPQPKLRTIKKQNSAFNPQLPLVFNPLGWTFNPLGWRIKPFSTFFQQTAGPVRKIITHYPTHSHRCFELLPWVTRQSAGPKWFPPSQGKSRQSQAWVSWACLLLWIGPQDLNQDTFRGAVLAAKCFPKHTILAEDWFSSKTNTRVWVLLLLEFKGPEA